MKTDLPPSLWPTLYGLSTGEAWPPSTPAAADAFVADATRHGLLPLLFEAEDRPPAVAASLDRSRAWRRVFAARSEALDGVLAGLARALDGEPWVALKGADYRHRLYPAPWLRPMQDVDLLVPYDRAGEVARRLIAAGFRLTFPGGNATRVPSHHERVFRAGDAVVEVHHSFVQRARHRIDYDAVWSRRQALHTPVFRAWRLEDADALLAQAIGMAVDAFASPLLRYVDLWLMLRRSPDVPAAAAARAREGRARHALYGALTELFRLFPESRTAAGTAALEGLVGRTGRPLFDRWVLPRPLGRGRERDVGRLARLWRKYWLMDDVGRRAAFALHHGYAVLAGARLARRERRATSTNPSTQ